ncbi:MAG: RNA polymerase sigma-70 factor (ECF subfamily) [Planctomycetota bacterium]|jgi:RNA polymerase sigma-70 factor (ECF subfamily)
MSSTEELWRTFRSPLHSFVRARVRNEADAEDMLSDVFLKLHEHSADLDNVTDPRAWLYQTTRNAVIDYYRRKSSREHTEDLYDLPEKLPEDHAKELAQCVERLMQSLQEKDRQALQLIGQGVSQEELARREGLSPTGARSRVQRARARLGEAFRTCCRLEFDGVGKVIDWHKRQPCDPDGPGC